MYGFDSSWTVAWCFAYMVLSAVVPWVNAEVVVLSLPLFAASRFELAALVLVATAGQMVGKCAVYWSARGAGGTPPERWASSLERWRARFERRPPAALGLVFVSSAVGIPPFYVISLLVGALKLGFGRYLVAGTCGRLVRFGLLAFFPELLIEMFR